MPAIPPITQMLDRNTAVRSLLAALLLLAIQAAPAMAQTPAQSVLEAHFDAIMQQEYVQADQYFSREFRAAFKADISRMNAYYRTRAAQIARGYEIRDAISLDDADRETMRLTVDF